MLPIDLLLVRHGQSEGNLSKRMSEKGDDSAFSKEFRERHNASLRLSAKGREQAVAAGRFLKQECLEKNFIFDRMYVSDYIRAKETAALLGLPLAEWSCDPYLTERDWGDIDNLPENEREERFGEALKMKKMEPFFWKPPNGESYNDLCLRIDRFLDTMHRECSDKRVLVVCHGEVMRAFAIRLERLSQERFRTIVDSDHPHDRVHNCQVTHYTRREPQTGKVCPYIGWVKWTRPAENPVATSGDWRRIERRRYSNEDLLREVSEVPRLVE